MSLVVEDLHFGYDSKPVLSGAELAVAAGSSTFVLGPSGCGKSTLLRLIAGLEHPWKGRIALDGRDLVPLPPHKRSLGMLFQEPALFPHLNVWQNVAFGLRYRGVPRSGRRQEATRWLDLVDLSARAEEQVDHLSGGQRQRVALARTLAAKPQVVLLDEPLSALDRPLRNDLGPRVRDLLAEQEVAAVWVTHDEEEARAWGDASLRLVDGRLVGSP